MSTIDDLLGNIDQFCRKQKISRSTFGLRAINDGKLVNRLIDGKGITLKTINMIEQYLENYNELSTNSLGVVENGGGNNGTDKSRE